MAGHSQFKNIMHRKGRQDAVRSKIFSKLAREITVAAKMGAPDPDMNPRLRLAIQNAKAQSMPKDNIQRAINKASGNDGENYDEVRYEGYGPGGVAVIVEALTDNRNRTASNVRAAFTKSGGALGETGSVGFMFDRVGEIHRIALGQPREIDCAVNLRDRTLLRDHLRRIERRPGQRLGRNILCKRGHGRLLRPPNLYRSI